MKDTNKEKCYCLEIFRKKYGNHVQGDCLKLSCGRYRLEKRREKQLTEAKNNDIIDE